MTIRQGATLAVVVGALVLVGSALASTPFWWWTPAQANQAVVKANPQGLLSSHHSTIETAVCSGATRSKLVNRSRRYHIFKCVVTVRDDTAQTGAVTWPWKLFVVTSKTKRLKVSCWSRSLATLACSA